MCAFRSVYGCVCVGTVISRWRCLTGMDTKRYKDFKSACAFDVVLDFILRMHKNAVQCGRRFREGVWISRCKNLVGSQTQF